MPADTNFSYYTLHDFHSNPDIFDCLSSNYAFAILNSNIRSLSSNFEDLTTMLSELYFPFSVIGLTETKIKVNQQPLLNIDLPGYSFVSQPTLSNAGGVGFYIKSVSMRKPGRTRQGVIMLKSPISLKLGSNVRYQELTYVTEFQVKILNSLGDPDIPCKNRHFARFMHN